ncbi:MAG: hypothetical protein ISQ50_02070 [Synechococcus sp. BS307-5m-G36]|nr:hypothetical protein [Synechococcus sp. BS307-5m-G36]MBL6888350.1 hypothetical protein [Synechococcus sp. BS30m-G30]
MFSSPFQQPSPRQNVLASQIQDAQRLGNERQLVLLSGQWVHRFGLDSLPVIDAASPEAEAEPFDQPQPASVLTTTAFSEELVNPEDLGVSLDLVAQEFVPPMDSNDEETTVSQDLTVQDLRVQDSLPEEEITDTAVGQEFEKTPLEPLRDRNVVVSISAPPISTPRSLRRWLPRADQTFLQAS